MTAHSYMMRSQRLRSDGIEHFRLRRPTGCLVKAEKSPALGMHEVFPVSFSNRLPQPSGVIPDAFFDFLHMNCRATIDAATVEVLPLGHAHDCEVIGMQHGGVHTFTLLSGTEVRESSGGPLSYIDVNDRYICIDVPRQHDEEWSRRVSDANQVAFQWD